MIEVHTKKVVPVGSELRLPARDRGSSRLPVGQILQRDLVALRVVIHQAIGACLSLPCLLDLLLQKTGNCNALNLLEHIPEGHLDLHRVTDVIERSRCILSVANYHSRRHQSHDPLAEVMPESLLTASIPGHHLLLRRIPGVRHPRRHDQYLSYPRLARDRCGTVRLRPLMACPPRNVDPIHLWARQDTPPRAVPVIWGRIILGHGFQMAVSLLRSVRSDGVVLTHSQVWNHLGDDNPLRRTGWAVAPLRPSMIREGV